MGVDVIAYLGYGVMIDYADFRKDNMKYLVKKYYDEDVDDYTDAEIEQTFFDLLFEFDYITETNAYAYEDEQQWFVGDIIGFENTELSVNDILAIEQEKSSFIKEIIDDFTTINKSPQLCLFTRWW